ncbi:MAG: helix-turn-helix transcriptional regulator, partial [Caldilineaceae bacterium]|nr:helix-turn-helix transcriptional regulator [Caldilineaceae bacterium]
MSSETQSSPPEEQRIETVKRYIQLHITEPLDRTQLATLAGFSVPHFHRVFLAQVGESPTAYVRRMRLDRAGRKLRMGAIDIGEVALAAGYESHNAFSKAFKQHFGLSPSAFRQLDCRAATQLLQTCMMAVV